MLEDAARRPSPTCLERLLAMQGSGMDGKHVQPQTARVAEGFDFTSQMRRLCDSLIGETPELGHIHLDQVAISFAQVRKRVTHGLQASLTPLRFEGGSLIGIRRGSQVTIQRIFDSLGREMLYILTFYLPRYMNLSYREKLETAVHELWHIGPLCNGDLRRHAGRCYAHSRSQALYDQQVARLVDRWLRGAASGEFLDFLHLDCAGLWRRHGKVVGMKLPRPRLIPLRT